MNPISTPAPFSTSLLASDSLSATPVRFGGVRIQENIDEHTQSLAFQVFPDSFIKGVQYKGTTRSSTSADKLTELAGDFRKNQFHHGNTNLHSLNGEAPQWVSQLLGWIVDDSSMPSAQKDRYKAGMAHQYKRSSEPAYENGVQGGSQFVYEPFNFVLRKPKLVPYPRDHYAMLEYAQAFLENGKPGLHRHSTKGIARFIRRNKGEVTDSYYILLAAAAFKEGKLDQYQDAFPKLAQRVGSGLNLINRLNEYPNLGVFQPLIDALGLKSRDVFSKESPFPPQRGDFFLL